MAIFIFAAFFFLLSSFVKIGSMSFCKFEEETMLLLTLYLSIKSQMEKVLNERKKELKEEQKKEMEKMKKEHESNMKKMKQEMEDQVRTGDIKQRRRN